jgi:starch synthase
MAMQLPVVASNISGIGELVSDGVSGRLVPPNDPAALAAVIDELLGDPAQCRRLGATAPRRWPIASPARSTSRIGRG